MINFSLEFIFLYSCFQATCVRVLCCTMNVAALKVSQIKNITCSPHLEPSTPDAGLHSQTELLYIGVNT